MGRLSASEARKSGATSGRLKQLPSWKTYEERRSQLEAADKDSDERKIRAVKFQRLIKTLESIVLEKNLPLCATPQIVERYQRLLALEESSLNAIASPK